MLIASISPIDGQKLGEAPSASPEDCREACEIAQAAYVAWRAIPAPRRGELVRLWGQELRARKQELADMVTLEAGKTRSEALGEVQEMIDMADYAVGLSRQLAGLTLASERPGHHLLERWKPLGPVLVISAFNFPVAVFAWNAMLALVCGDPVIWKPSEKTPLCAQITCAIFNRAVAQFGVEAPAGLIQAVQGDAKIGAELVEHPLIRLVSATGSTRMGREVAKACATHLKRSLLELGGNGAMIVRPSADLDLAVRAIVFSAVGTAGQRCTTLRRLIVHPDIKQDLIQRLVRAYKSLPIGDPRKPETLIGPLIDADAVTTMANALETAQAEGGRVLVGGQALHGNYVQPALVEMPAQTAIMQTETFAPILYVVEAETLAEAIAIQNDVPQGLSSSIFTTDLREAETFLSQAGSDCGIANVNIGTSGAEIGGAFGGEKETGGGREAGSDAWKAYMIRQTQTINYSTTLPLAQGVVFDL
jgi:aldehyde dehydrogenase (NAD+)